jgi:hypothetical protein
MLFFYLLFCKLYGIIKDEYGNISVILFFFCIFLRIANELCDLYVSFF